jgi:response regulator of citrate/malate metabolism
MKSAPFCQTVTKPRKRVVVVEDNPDQWFIIRWALLHRFPEVEPIWFSNTSEVITYLEDSLHTDTPLPVLVLLDLYLPDRITGWNLLTILKTHHTYREIPVVMLSSSENAEDIKESYMFRSSSYIVKPLGYDQWLSCITSFRQYWWDAVSLPDTV